MPLSPADPQSVPEIVDLNLPGGAFITSKDRLHEKRYSGHARKVMPPSGATAHVDKDRRRRGSMNVHDIGGGSWRGANPIPRRDGSFRGPTDVLITPPQMPTGAASQASCDTQVAEGHTREWLQRRHVAGSEGTRMRFQRL